MPEVFKYLKVEPCWLVQVADQKRAQESMQIYQIKAKRFSRIQPIKTTIQDWVTTALMFTTTWFRKTPALFEDRNWHRAIQHTSGLHRLRIITHQIRNMRQNWWGIIKIRILEAINWEEALKITIIITREAIISRIRDKDNLGLARARFLGHLVEVWISSQNTVHKTNQCNNSSKWWNNSNKLKPKRLEEREISLK